MRTEISPEQLVPLWQKPAFPELLDCLKRLRQDPPVWNLKTTRTEIAKEQESSAQSRREVAAYLSNIIKSSLAWIQDDDQKEDIWDEASKRMSERCGRAGMGEITRRWPIEGGDSAPFDLTIREPPLTGDSLGLKTWGSSYLLALHLHTFASKSLSHLINASSGSASETVLELGSGTGLLGLAAACVWKTKVILTDLQIIMDNLAHNVEVNRSVAESCGGHVEAAALTWGGSEEESDPRFCAQNQYKIVLAADPLYDDEHPGLLAGAIDEQLSLDRDARVLAMIPLRDANTKRLLNNFREAMAGKSTSLVCIEEDILMGQDDWGDDDEVYHIESWWGIFQRRKIG